jgi:hypothetical protein
VLCSDLLCPWRAKALETLRTLRLPGGVACTSWNPETGEVSAGPYAAALAGYLVWAVLAGAPQEEVAADAAGSKSRASA